MARLKKGSPEAKRHMAKLRAMVGKKRGRRKRKTKKRGNPKRRRSNPVPRRRNRKNRKRSNSFTLPLAPTLGVVGSLWHPLFGWEKWGWDGAMGYIEREDYAGAVKDFTRISLMQLTGVDPEGIYPFGMFLGEGWIPLIMGGLVHKVASLLGLNRMLGRAGVPVIRI